MFAQSGDHRDLVGGSLPVDFHRGTTEVRDRLLNIIELVRAWQPLNRMQCEFVARYFVFPNLVHWVWQMSELTPAKSFSGECPVYGGSQDCALAPLRTTVQVPENHLVDLCRLREQKHPWTLQITLLFNVAYRSASSDSAALRTERPSQECADDVWRRVVDNSETRHRWSRVNFADLLAERRARLAPPWRRIADGIRQTAVEIASGTRDYGEAVSKHVHPTDIVEFCVRANQLLHDRCIPMQNGDRPISRVEANRIVRDVNRVLEWHAKVAYSLPTSRYKRQFEELRGLLRAFDLPGRPQIESYLDSPQLDRTGQSVIRYFLLDIVLGLINAGLPSGDPLDDPVVQELFWHRVGRAPYFSMKPFSVESWVVRRWTSVHSQPAWRVKT